MVKLQNKSVDIKHLCVRARIHTHTDTHTSLYISEQSVVLCTSILHKGNSI
jgi:hypothetical protein